jgi:aldose 1-epimerase
MNSAKKFNNLNLQYRIMFRINRIGINTDWEKYELEDDRTNIRIGLIPGAGAILNELYIYDANIIDGYSDRADFKDRVHQGFRSAKLSPFVCRLLDASYTWQGTDYRLDKFLLNGSALHGILYDVSFDVITEKQGTENCCVAMRYQYDGKHPGYPFPFNCTVTYTLEHDGKLTIATHLSNPPAAKRSIPIVDGWHPYFKLGGKVDEWWLQIASNQMMEYDDKLIPTGKYLVNEDFSAGGLIGSKQLDNGFVLKEGISPICELKNPNNGVRIQFLSQVNYPFLQLYIPGDRESIAIENLSGAPDAFNNGIGLSVLEPGGKIDLAVTFQVSN